MPKNKIAKIKHAFKIDEYTNGTNGVPMHIWDFFSSFGWDMQHEAFEYMNPQTKLTPTSVKCIGKFGQIINLPRVEAEVAEFEIIGDISPNDSIEPLQIIEKFGVKAAIKFQRFRTLPYVIENKDVYWRNFDHVLNFYIGTTFIQTGKNTTSTIHTNAAQIESRQQYVYNVTLQKWIQTQI